MGYILSDKVRNLEPYEPVQGYLQNSAGCKRKLSFANASHPGKDRKAGFPAGF